MATSEKIEEALRRLLRAIDDLKYIGVSDFSREIEKLKRGADDAKKILEQ